mmetsp:Transcript_14564/g.28181  ORF Transcript_14564/g.28181 Transcript_14564/m.28181 type:complete len:207 (-) Transcript_14564:269-889(-)
MCCFRLKHSTKPLQLIVVGRKQSIGPTLPVSTWQHRLGFHALPSLQVSLFRSRNYCSVQAQVCTIEKYQPNSHRNLVFLCCSIASVLACRSLKPGTRLRTHLLLSTHTSRTVPQKTDRQTDRQTDGLLRRSSVPPPVAAKIPVVVEGATKEGSAAAAKTIEASSRKAWIMTPRRHASPPEGGLETQAKQLPALELLWSRCCCCCRS